MYVCVCVFESTHMLQWCVHICACVEADITTTVNSCFSRTDVKLMKLILNSNQCWIIDLLLIRTSYELVGLIWHQSGCNFPAPNGYKVLHIKPWCNENIVLCTTQSVRLTLNVSHPYLKVWLSLSNILPSNCHQCLPESAEYYNDPLWDVPFFFFSFWVILENPLEGSSRGTVIVNCQKHSRICAIFKKYLIQHHLKLLHCEF